MADLISIIVTTCNREDALDAVLRSLSRQTDRDFEVIVADDGSGPATAELIESWKGKLGRPLSHVWHERKGFRAAEIRNRAIVASREVTERVADGRPRVRVRASQMQSEHYTDGHVFLGAVVGPPELTRVTARLAYEEAGCEPGDLSLVQVHDAFPIEELMYYELLDLCADGEGDKLVDEGATAIGGRIPFSTDGGLIARGHPGGPTGLAQIWETTQQLRGESGPRQVEGARLGLAHMMGAGSVCVIHILEREG